MPKKLNQNNTIKIMAVAEEKEFQTFGEFIRSKKEEALTNFIVRKLTKKMANRIQNFVITTFFKGNDLIYRKRFPDENFDRVFRDISDLENHKMISEEIDDEGLMKVITEITSDSDFEVLMDYLSRKGVPNNSANVIVINTIKVFCKLGGNTKKGKQTQELRDLIQKTKFWEKKKLTVKDIWKK